MSTPLRALIVEDSPDDADLVIRELRRGGYDVAFERVETRPQMQRALAQSEWDLVLSDYSMPSFSAMEALGTLRDSGIDVPFIITSGTIGEDTAVEAMRAGANDFIVKGRFARLIPAIERELREAAGRRERRAAERALRESELRYRRIVETAQEGIWMMDADSRATFVNRRMAALLGTSTDEAIGARLSDFVVDEAGRSALDGLARSPGGAPDKIELRLRRKDGSEFWAALATNPIFDEAGRYAGALAMVSDTTEQKNLQAQLMMSDRLVAVGTLAAGVAHEINNPLAAVMANLDIALQDLSSRARQDESPPWLRDIQEMLGDSREAADRVRLIVRDVKLFSRAEEDTLGPVDVHRVLDSSLRMAWNEVRHRARVVKEYSHVPFVHGNESRLGQVFLNLIVNAAQAMAEGRADDNVIRVATRQHDGRVSVEVRDTGAGMPPEILRRLFTPFFTTKAPGVGTGLGLSICQRIVAAMNGKIEVDSEVGRGTTMRVVLPASVASGIPVAGGVRPVLGPSRRGRVLVVDDEEIVASALRRTLAGEHQVELLTSGQDVLEAIARGERYDVILCDLMMPQLTGMDLFREVVRLAPDQAQRIIFLTGGAFTPRTRAFLDEVPNPRIEKPFDPTNLRALVNDRVR